MKINWTEIIKTIKKMMGENEYCIRTLAERLMISESALKNYLYGGTRIPIDIICGMAEAFRLKHVEELLVKES